MDSKLNDEINKMDQVRYKYSDYGAGDTEPRCVAAEEIEGYLGGGAYNKLTIGDWQLYSTMKCGTAVRCMNAQMKKIHTLIQKTPYAEVVEVIEYHGFEIDI